jgi:uridylate kinase
MSNTELAADQPKYRRIVLKLSGEALREHGSHETISPSIVTDIAKQIKQVSELGVEIAVVIGGGNIWRGLSASHRGMDRTTADYMGMLATVINGMALQSALNSSGL